MLFLEAYDFYGDVNKFITRNKKNAISVKEINMYQTLRKLLREYLKALNHYDYKKLDELRLQIDSSVVDIYYIRFYEVR